MGRQDATQKNRGDQTKTKKWGDKMQYKKMGRRDMREKQVRSNKDASEGRDEDRIAER